MPGHSQIASYTTANFKATRVAQQGPLIVSSHSISGHFLGSL